MYSNLQLQFSKRDFFYLKSFHKIGSNCENISSEAEKKY